MCRCESCFKGTAVHEIHGVSFLMKGRCCCCIVHPKHPLHSYHGFVFCFVYYRFSFYLWKLTLKKMIFALCSISLIKMSSYNITLGKNGPNLILLNINNVI